MLEDYKKQKIREVEYFLRGIRLDNIKKNDEKIILGVTPEANDFFNKPGLSRSYTELFLANLSTYKTELYFTDLEFASTKEEMDYAVLKFVNKVKSALEEYKTNIIKAYFHEKKEEDLGYIDPRELSNVKESNYINTGLNFIKIKIGDKEYAFVRSPRDAEQKEKVVDNLNRMIIYVYFLVCIIQDKKEKKEEFIDFVAINFDPTDTRYFDIMRMQSIFLNEKDYKKFLIEYRTVVEKVVTMALETEEQRKATIK